MTVQEAKEILGSGNIITANCRSISITNKARDIAIECMEEVEQYRALGTVEELKEAREKQMAKKMLDSGERIPFSYYCPTCKTELSDDGCKYDGKCCFECGQRLESEEDV